MVETNLKKSRDYSPNEVVRIVNPKQQLLYIKNNVYPIDGISQRGYNRGI